MTIDSDALYHSKLILNGTVLSIDPASGSSSACAWAYFVKGELYCADTVPVAGKEKVGVRLRQLFDELSQKLPVDVLVVERIRGSRAHEYLHWSVGVAVSAVSHSLLLEMPVSTWHKHVGFNVEGRYTKGDINDATAIGRTLLHLAKGLPL